MKVINNGEKYVYKDVENFIRKMKAKGLRVNILTYGDFCFQMMKLLILNVCDIIDEIIISRDYKFELELDYQNSIFIDDNPRDLIGFYNKNAYGVIRIARKNAKYSEVELKNEHIVNYNSFDEFIFD